MLSCGKLGGTIFFACTLSSLVVGTTLSSGLNTTLEFRLDGSSSMPANHQCDRQQQTGS